MALPSALQNILTMSDPRFGSGRTTPSMFAAATAGGASAIGANERQMQELQRKLALAEKTYADMLTRSDEERQFGREKWAFENLGQGIPQPERQDWVQKRTGFSFTGPDPYVTGGMSPAGYARGAGASPTGGTGMRYYTAPPYRLNQNPSASSDPYERLRRHRLNLQSVWPTSKPGQVYTAI